jgi:hypothetical protein
MGRIADPAQGTDGREFVFLRHENYHIHSAPTLKPW